MMLTSSNIHLVKNNKETSIIKLTNNKLKYMSIKSNIVTLRIWLSEKVKESFEYKEQIKIENLEAKTKQMVISK